MRVQAAQQRTLRLWKTLNPAAMPQYVETPLATSHAHFALDTALVQPQDKRFNMRRNEGTEHAEQAATMMKNLVRK